MLPRSLLTRLLRVPGVASLWRQFPSGSVDLRTEYGIWERAHYAYGLYHAADLAKRLRLPGISAIEFGVAGGSGLVAMEQLAERISKHFQLPIQVYGFDLATGLPPATDYRDLPHIWGEGSYQMDVPALRARLSTAKLLLGDVSETIPVFLRDCELPIGFIAFDLDYYSSTMRAFSIFSGDPSTRLPRTYSYFDDMIWEREACYNEYTGELAAIADFNRRHEQKKICKINGLRCTRPMQEHWVEQLYVMHDFAHPEYCTNVKGQDSRQLRLAS